MKMMTMKGLNSSKQCSSQTWDSIQKIQRVAITEKTYLALWTGINIASLTDKYFSKKHTNGKCSP